MRQIKDAELSGCEESETVGAFIHTKCFRDSNKSFSETIDPVLRDTFLRIECNRLL